MERVLNLWQHFPLCAFTTFFLKNLTLASVRPASYLWSIWQSELSQQTLDIEPMLDYCCPTVCDAGPTIIQHWLNVCVCCVICFPRTLANTYRRLTGMRGIVLLSLRAGAMVQWLKLPPKVGDPGFEPRSGILVSKKQTVSSPLTRKDPMLWGASLTERSEVECSASDRQGSNSVSGGQCHPVILGIFSWPSLAYMCTKVA